MEGMWAFAGAVVVALITTGSNLIVSKRDKVASRLKTIEDSQIDIGEKVDMTNKGTMTTLKIQLQQTHEKQQARIRSANQKWSPELDQVFREAYTIYKNLNGNGIVDRLKQDMDIWSDRYAGDVYDHGKEAPRTHN
jgi:hypothetical protein